MDRRSPCRKGPRIRRPAFESLECRRLLSGIPVINEFLADNGTGYRDEDGDTPDWIELTNRGDQAIELEGWYLTDDAEELTKWPFPSTTLDVGQYLLVLASGKDRQGTGPGGEHHTNFSLDADGEYLALVRPDGITIADEFHPEFDRQRVDVSFGTGETVVGDKLVAEGHAMRIRIPTGDADADRWRGGDEPFDDSTDAGWTQVINGIGYDVATAGPSSPLGYWNFDGQTQDLSGHAHAGVLTGGQYSDDVPGALASGQSLRLDGINDRLEVQIDVSEAAYTSSMWFKTTPDATHGLLAVAEHNQSSASDRHVYVNGGNVFARTWNNETIGSSNLSLSDGNWHHFAHVLGGDVGGQRIYVDGVLVASGFKAQSDFDWQQQILIGYSHDAGYLEGWVDEVAVWNDALDEDQILALSQGRSPLALGGFTSLINSDVAAQMRHVGSSAYARAEFQHDVSARFDRLELRVRYDDGFVAYLNGVEVARRNAPDTPNHDSSATEDRPTQEALRFETIDITAHSAALRDGRNILALHGLNDSASSENFLLVAELSRIARSPSLYLAPPTPGGPNGEGYADFVADTRFDVDRGFLDEPTDVTVTNDTPGAWLAYTLDGTDPSPEHGEQVAPPDDNTPPRVVLRIDRTTTLRVMAHKPNLHPSNVDTQTYIFVDDVARQRELWPAIVNHPVWGPQLKDSLLSLPSVSIVMPTRPSLAEQATSVELIFPDGGEGFQIDAGIEQFGGHSLGSPKNNMRISFKSQYGAAKLNYDLFGEGATTEFDQILLRTGSHDTFFWTHPGGARGNYVRGRWVFDRQLEMGRPAPHGRFVHVYINGTYWGQHHLMERPNAAFMASYLGGEKEDYDALNAGSPVDGDTGAWNNLLASTGDFQQLSQYLDLENYADYMLLNFYGGNDWDWNHQQNWMAARRRTEGAGFQFFGWDSDVILRTGAGANVVHRGGPGNIWAGVSQHEQFRRILADRARLYFFDGGMFSDERLRSDFQALADEIRLSMIAETARWGSFSNYTPDSWQQAIDWVLNTYAPINGPSRADTVIAQLRDAGVFPRVDAPRFEVNAQPSNGGQVASGDMLTLVADPIAQVVETQLVGPDSPVSAWVPRHGDLQSQWQSPVFVEGAAGETWRTGVNGVGYERSGGYESHINVDVGAEMSTNNSVFVRYAFTAPDAATLNAFDSLKLKMIIDDGFVAYLNGTLVASQNAPPLMALGWNSAAPNAIEADVNTPQLFDVTSFRSQLNAGGTNVLAIHGLNADFTSSDMLVHAQLVGEFVDEPRSGLLAYTLDGSDPSAPGALTYVGPLTIDETIRIRARHFANGQWSAVSEATFFVRPPASAGSVAVTEIHYHPPDPTPDELAVDPDLTDSDFEFLELRNVSDHAIDLTGARFDDGIAFWFDVGGLSTLPAGEHRLLVRNPSAFVLRYGEGLPVAGVFTGGLDNGGESLRLIGHAGDTLLAFEYGDGGSWPDRADGDGSSLELVAPHLDPASPESWRSSTEYGGSPGASGLGEFRDVVVNEVLTHTDEPLLDFVELVNVTDQPVDVGGWYLSDTKSAYRKFRIPDGTVIPAGGYLIFDESDFNATAGADPDDFAFDGARGDDVWLLSADPDGAPNRFADHVEFSAAANGESFGRWPDTSGRLYPMISRTPGAPNSGPRIGPVVISEVMYHAPDPDGPDGVDPDDLEFVEIHNTGSETIELAGWSLSGGIDFEFSDDHSIGPQGVLVVVRFDVSDPANRERLDVFRDTYGLGVEPPVLGGYSGRLSNGGDRVTLSRPDQPPSDDPELVPMLLEDEVRYGDRSPWPTSADGAGSSMRRSLPPRWGNDPASWSPAAPTPGSVADLPAYVTRVAVNASLVDPEPLPVGAPPGTSWSVQRSDLRSIEVQFSEPVHLTAADLVLTNLGIDAPDEEDTVIPLSDDRLVFAERTMTLTFASYELPEGVYRLEILAGATDDTGNPLDGDGDGAGGDAFVLTGDRHNRLYRLAADFNGDGGVSIFDFSTFAYWFGTSVGRAPQYVDLSGDGGISIFDFGPLAANFGSSVTFSPTPLTFGLEFGAIDSAPSAEPARPVPSKQLVARQAASDRSRHELPLAPVDDAGVRFQPTASARREAAMMDDGLEEVLDLVAWDRMRLLR